MHHFRASLNGEGEGYENCEKSGQVGQHVEYGRKGPMLLKTVDIRVNMADFRMESSDVWPNHWPFSAVPGMSVE